MSVEYSYIHPKYLLGLQLTGLDLPVRTEAIPSKFEAFIKVITFPWNLPLAFSSRILVPQAEDCFWHKSPNAVTSRLAARTNNLFKLQFLLILVQKLFHLRIYNYKSAGSRLLFKAVALITRLVWGQAEEGVQTISPLISKTPVSN